MGYINLIAIVTVVLFWLAYQKFIRFSEFNKNRIENYSSGWSGIVWLLLFAFVIRVMTSVLYMGYPTDMNCFYAWSKLAVNEGIPKFYHLENIFTDYPPGYIYILYVLGLFLNLFKTSGASDLIAVIILKMPAILCDLAAGYIIYKIARKRFSEETSLILVLLYVFNPAIYINSTIWGQVDSVYVLFLLLMCYSINENKLPKAIMIFAIGALIKPQMVIFTPVLLFVCLEESFLSRENGKLKLEFHRKQFLTLLFWSLIGILTMVILVLPFGFEAAFKQYFSTLGSYEYASVNAYNIWAMFGLNWSPQTDVFLGIPYQVFGTIAIILTVVFAGIIYFKSKKDESRVYIVAGFINAFMFLFAVRMHERYMYPALLMIFIAFLYRPLKQLFYVYIMFSVVHFYNVAEVLFFYDPSNFDFDAVFPRIIGFATLCIFLWFAKIIWTYYIKGKKERTVSMSELPVQKKKETEVSNKTIMKSEEKVKLNKKDYLIMLAITVIYAAIALYNLGFNYAPETKWSTYERESSITLDFGEIKQISKMSAYLGSYEDRNIEIYYRDSMTDPWTELVDEEGYKWHAVFKWNSIPLNVEARYLNIKSTSEKSVLHELVILDAEGNKLLPVNSMEYASLFDEQSMYEEAESYRSGTYFDEIYHARTAYEYMNGLYSYENTHPPLGKIFIALGMTIFGVNPFGWRIMGTLFGIGMLPLIYVFARKFFKKTWLAGAVTLLFAADFMHFAQTRIATIDVFVTFFIILMYYFMYQYTTLSFNDTKLSKTFIPLGLCGITMGLAIACKMTGVYAAAGLAVIFFVNLYKRYNEYRYAKQDSKGTTNGIKHQYVVSHFAEYTTKTILYCVLVFIIIPAIIYTLSYIPFVKYEGYDIGLVQRMLENQQDMFSYHSQLVATHPFSSKWYEWPIMVRPIWYYSGEVSSTVAEGISSFGNPLVWWVGLPAFFYTIYLTIKKRDKLGAFLIISYLSQYLPWILIPRLTYIYHYFPSVPFVIMMIAYCMKDLVTRDKRWRIAIVCYLVASVLLFAMFYPVLSGAPVSKSYVSTFLRWFDSWVLLSK